MDNSASYSRLLCGALGLDDQALKSFLRKELPGYWIDEYGKMVQGTAEVLEFSDSAYQYLFDYNLERVIAAYGETHKNIAKKRDKNREAAFLRGFRKQYAGKDRGHFMSHKSGGLMDVNFFPQDSAVNQGHSPAGKIYRIMEKYCVSHEGIFCFSRPIYASDNTTWVPN